MNYQNLLAQGYKSAEIWVKCGQAAFFLEEYQQALNYFEQGMKANPDTEVASSVYLYRGIILHFRKKYEAAIANLEQVTGENRGRAQIYLGACHIELGHHDKAYQYLISPHSQQEKLPLLYESVGRYYLQQQQLQQALQQFKVCLDMVPWEARYHYYLGRTFLLQGKTSQAQNFFQKALELNPGDLHSLMALLNCQNVMENWPRTFQLIVVHNVYVPYFFASREPGDLFLDRYRFLNRRHNKSIEFAASSKLNPEGKTYQHFFELLQKSRSQQIQRITIAALASFHHTPDSLQQIRNQMQQVKNKTPWQQLLHKIQQKEQDLTREKIRRQVLRLLAARDHKALRDLRQGGKHTENVLEQMLKSRKENLLIRFLVAQTLLTLGVPSAFEKVKSHAENQQEYRRSLAVQCSTQRKKIPSRERSLPRRTKPTRSFSALSLSQVPML